MSLDATPERGRIGHEDVTWREGLLARVYRPAPGTATGAAVLDVHGGAWNAQDRTLGARYDRALAAAGVTVAAIDFRDGRHARHPAATEDIAAAVAWLRAEAPALGVDPARIGLVGSSSGGHLALHAALTATVVPFVAALWPPVDPLARLRYARERLGRPVPEGQTFDAARLVASTEAYFGTEAVMAEASIEAVLGDGEHRRGPLPAVWLVEAGADLNVPPSMLDALEAAYRAAGGELERTTYPDEVHGFGHGRGDGAERFRADLVERVQRALR